MVKILNMYMYVIAEAGLAFQTHILAKQLAQTWTWSWFTETILDKQLDVILYCLFYIQSVGNTARNLF